MFDKPKAVELAAFVAQHPITIAEIRIEARDLLTKLKQELPAEVFAVAKLRGESIQLGSLVGELQSTLIAEQVVQDEVISANYRVPSPNSEEVEFLSERELDVLRLVATGLSNTEIAQKLFVEVSTIKKHINHIFSKLDVQTRTQALLRAQKLHLI